MWQRQCNQLSTLVVIVSDEKGRSELFSTSTKIKVKAIKSDTKTKKLTKYREFLKRTNSSGIMSDTVGIRKNNKNIDP